MAMPRRVLARGLTGLLLVLAVAAALPAQAPEIRGKIVRVRDHRVLHLSGTPAEMGYAHGWLLAEEIVAGFSSYVLRRPILDDISNWESKILPLVRDSMVFEEPFLEELRGMYEGIVARQKGAPFIEALHRPLELDDLKALNAVGDWYFMACSSFSAWGERAAGGGIITGRNFDFISSPVVIANQLLIVYAPEGRGSKKWVNVAFPGLIGLISGFNEDGLGIFVHDCMPLGTDAPKEIHPRLLALRKAIETAPAEGAPAAVDAILKVRRALMGNNIHVTSPFRDGGVPAGVIEYDGDEARNGGTDLRLALPGTCTLTCTNHYLVRRKPWKCGRYEKLHATLEPADNGSGKPVPVGPDEARAMLASVGQKLPFSFTMHSIVVYPNEKRFEVSFCRPGKVATELPYTPFTLEELFAAGR